jgi:hypothetical protein
MCKECDNLQAKVLEFQQLFASPIDQFTAEQLGKAVVKLEAKKAELHPEQKEKPSVVPLSEETQGLLATADRAIQRSRTIVAQAHDVHAACARERRAQEARFAFIRELRKSR